MNTALTWMKKAVMTMHQEVILLPAMGNKSVLIDCDVVTEKGFTMLSQLSTPAERDSLLLLDEEVGEEIDYSSNNSNTAL